MECAYIDVQGFKDNSNKFILKEIAVLTRNSSFHDVIKSPFSINRLNDVHKREVNWLTKNYHGIKWNDGKITINELRKIIKPMLHQKTIYVKGEEKIDWIRFILNDKTKSIDIVNLECIGCSVKLHKFKQLKDSLRNLCNIHSSQYNCALKNVLILCEWYLSKIN